MFVLVIILLIVALGKNSSVDITENSVWQLGPKWLQFSIEHWPITQIRDASQVPADEVLKIGIVSHIFDKCEAT